MKMKNVTYIILFIISISNSNLYSQSDKYNISITLNENIIGHLFKFDNEGSLNCYRNNLMSLWNFENKTTYNEINKYDSKRRLIFQECYFLDSENNVYEKEFYKYLYEPDALTVVHLIGKDSILGTRITLNKNSLTQKVIEIYPKYDDELNSIVFSDLDTIIHNYTWEKINKVIIERCCDVDKRTVKNYKPDSLIVEEFYEDTPSYDFIQIFDSTGNTIELVFKEYRNSYFTSEHYKIEYDENGLIDIISLIFETKSKELTGKSNENFYAKVNLLSKKTKFNKKSISLINQQILKKLFYKIDTYN